MMALNHLNINVVAFCIFWLKCCGIACYYKDVAVIRKVFVFTAGTMSFVYSRNNITPSRELCET